MKKRPRKQAACSCLHKPDMKVDAVNSIFLASTILNVILTIWVFVQLLSSAFQVSSPNHKKPMMTAKIMNPVETKRMEIWPEALSPQQIQHCKTDRLTNIVMPFHPRQEPRVVQNLDLWETLLPCLPPTNSLLTGTMPWPGWNVTLTFYISTDRNKPLEERLMGRFDKLPLVVRQCFSEVNFRYSNLTGDQNNYLTGSRNMFEAMLYGQLELSPDPRYALYMEPDLRPIREGWLTLLDQTTRPPNLPFGMKGSIFRGDMRAIRNRLLHNLLHVNGNAVYNLASKEFREFYQDYVRQFITATWTDGAYDTDFFKFILQEKNFNFARRILCLFQFTDSIWNLWHTEYSAERLGKNSQALLVHGGTAKP